MAGIKGKSGRKPNLLNNLDSAHVDRREQAERAIELNERFKPIGNPPRRLDKEGKQLWRNIVSQLAHASILTELDASLLEEYVTQVQLARSANASIQELGAIIETDTGWKKNPAVDIKNGAARNIKAIGSSLGLDPMSRAAMLTDAPDNDEDEQTAEDAVAMFGGGS